MRAGALRHRLTLEQAAEVLDGRGEPVATWSEVTVVDASIDPLHGQERIAAQQVFASATHLIGIRYRPGVVRKMRFRQGTRVFEIDDVQDPLERHIRLNCVCTERNL